MKIIRFDGEKKNTSIHFPHVQNIEILVKYLGGPNTNMPTIKWLNFRAIKETTTVVKLLTINLRIQNSKKSDAIQY